jgi:hypothetical protein
MRRYKNDLKTNPFDKKFNERHDGFIVKQLCLLHFSLSHKCHKSLVRVALYELVHNVWH